MAAGGQDARNSATQAVRKAVQLLTLFAASDGASLGVAELSARTGWSRSAVSRLLAALEDGRLVCQDPLTSRYTPGLGLVALAGAALNGNRLYGISHPHLLRLALESGETANLSIVDADQLLTIDEAPSAQPIKLSGWVGLRQPLHGSSSGKVLLAALPEERREAILAAGLPGITARTIVARDDLLRELERTQAVGYGLSQDELESGLTSVAAPVRDHTGAVVAAISAAGPSVRVVGRRLEESIACVKAAAMAVSSALGCREQLSPPLPLRGTPPPLPAAGEGGQHPGAAGTRLRTAPSRGRGETAAGRRAAAGPGPSRPRERGDGVRPRKIGRGEATHADAPPRPFYGEGTRGRDRSVE